MSAPAKQQANLSRFFQGVPPPKVRLLVEHVWRDLSVTVPFHAGVSDRQEHKYVDKYCLCYGLWSFDPMVVVLLQAVPARASPSRHPAQPKKRRRKRRLWTPARRTKLPRRHRRLPRGAKPSPPRPLPKQPSPQLLRTKRPNRRLVQPQPASTRPRRLQSRLWMTTMMTTTCVLRTSGAVGVVCCNLALLILQTTEVQERPQLQPTRRRRRKTRRTASRRSALMTRYALPRPAGLGGP